jgi:hypothetical protein
MPILKKIWQSTLGETFNVAIMLIAIFCSHNAHAQYFAINQKSDSLWVLTLSNESGKVVDSWQLPYPVYRFDKADIDADGSIDAVVGVFKSSRFFTTPSHRVFIFKNFNGKVRPLWLGSRLGGELVDFAVVGNTIRAIEKTEDGYAVSNYTWKGFGMGFHSLVATSDNIDECYNSLEQ